jgi:hypothetical protein
VVAPRINEPLSVAPSLFVQSQERIAAGPVLSAFTCSKVFRCFGPAAVAEVPPRLHAAVVIKRQFAEEPADLKSHYHLPMPQQ